MPPATFVESAQQIPSPELTAKPYSNASLEETAIVSLITKIDPKWKFVGSSPSLQTGCSRSSFAFESASSSFETLSIDIFQTSSITSAQSVMLSRVQGIEGNIDKKRLVWDWKDAQQLGQRALQTARSIWWVHGSLFLSVDAASAKAAATMNPPLATFAKELDSYLLKTPASESELIKVVPKLKGPSSISVVQDSIFTLQLEKNDLFHERKPAESSVSGIATLTASGDVNNVYTFLAHRVGKTIVRLLVAHKTSLRVADVQVEVTVTANPLSKEQQDAAFRAQIEQELGLV